MDKRVDGVHPYVQFFCSFPWGEILFVHVLFLFQKIVDKRPMGVYNEFAQRFFASIDHLPLCAILLYLTATNKSRLHLLGIIVTKGG